MRRRWVQVRPGRRENLLSGLSAGLLGAGVGLTAFYLVRLFLAREPLEGTRAERKDRTRLPVRDEDVRTSS